MHAPRPFTHMSTRLVYPLGRREPFRFKQRSVTAKRHAYMKAGEPYGWNRKGLKRWLRESKADERFCGTTAFLHTEGGRHHFFFACEGCGLQGRIGVPVDLRSSFGCPEECGATYVLWINPVDGPALMCVVKPVFVEDDDFDGDFFDDDDDPDFDECGMAASGGCTLAGTEWCDWECPYGS